MSQYRIVRAKRGELITGIRVQILNPIRDCWRNTGRNMHTVEEAKGYVAWLESNQHSRMPVDYEVIEGPQDNTPRYPDYR